MKNIFPQYGIPTPEDCPTLKAFLERHVPGLCLPEVRFPQFKADDLGNKCCWRLLMLDRHPGIVTVSYDEWCGLHALERDDEL